MSQILFDSPYPVQIAVLIIAVIGIFSVRGLNSETHRRAEKVLSILQSVPKRKVGESKFPRLFFSREFAYTSSFTPEFCRVRLHRIILAKHQVRQATYSIEWSALNENLFEFHIISTAESQTHIVGQLEQWEGNTTHVIGTIGTTMSTCLNWFSPGMIYRYFKKRSLMKNLIEDIVWPAFASQQDAVEKLKHLEN
jgi:hypothetical protein